MTITPDWPEIKLSSLHPNHYLVAKEYVVARNGEDGVLILSEFAGSAVELPDAVLTNPYASSRMDESIDQALAMDKDEQKKRMGRMYSAIKRYDVQQWANHLLREAYADVVLGDPPNCEQNSAPVNGKPAP